jgi:hypothetical protein
VTTHKFIVAPGIFKVMVTSASDDIRLRADLEVN